MTAVPERIATLAFVAMSGSLWAWHAPLPGVLLSLPLLACLPWMIALRARAFVVAGALALPYLCYAIVEILVATDKPPGAIALLAAGAVFMFFLTPAMRRMKRRHDVPPEPR